MRVLVAGWFSCDEVIATVGGEPGADVVTRWPTDLDVDHDVAWAPHLERGVDRRDVDPEPDVPVVAAGERGRAGNARARAWSEEQLAC